MISKPKGTLDMLPTESYKWHYVTSKLQQIAENFGFHEIRTPIFEHTELFLRGIGDTTDVVNKEMYTFLDKGERSITLKPEGTAGVARSYIENGLQELPCPINMYYISPIFRYERPQAGRLREHHQFGIESYGSQEAAADVEVIALGNTIFRSFGVATELFINSIGCRECRKEYNKALVSYYTAVNEQLCQTCRERLVKNPLRLLDCKEEKCQQFKANAPKMVDYLCPDCKEHFDTVKALLEARGIKYTVNPLIVRGLDYYTRTVFEFVTDCIGAQGTVLGGGRYDKLVEEVGGKPTPAVGFGMGIERLLILLEKLNCLNINQRTPDVYFVPMGKAATALSMQLLDVLRERGIYALTDVCSRSFKAQMKYANKISAKYVVVIGEDELNSKAIRLKNMTTGEETQCKTVDLAELLEKKLGE